MNPLVSIIIPVYNSEKYLAECIECAVNQTWLNTEIIIIDDGSTDGSLKIAQQYADNPKIKIFQQENKGASAARNAGLNKATGDYIQFLDADDLLSPDKIEAQITSLKGSLTLLSFNKTIHFFDGENYLNGINNHDWFCTDNNDPVDFLLKLYAGDDTMPGYGGMITIHSWLTPRLLIDKAGLWNEHLSVDDDGEFFCRVVLASDGIKFCATGFNYYRKFRHQQSLSAQKNLKAIESVILSTNLKFSYLKEEVNDPILERIFARHYWEMGVAAYPKYRAVSDKLIKKAKAFNYSGKKYLSGPLSMTLSKLTGWRFIRALSYLKHGK